MTTDCFAFAMSALITGLILPCILRFANIVKLFDAPDKRKIHHGRVPRLGGIAFVPSVIFTLLLTTGLSLRINFGMTVGLIWQSVTQLLFLVCSLMSLYAVGVADDLRGVRYSGKFLVQIVCAVLTIVSGLTLGNFYGLLGLGALPGWLSVIATVFVVVYVINAVNLIDGIDGLCGGLAVITLTYYGVIFTLAGEWAYAILSWIGTGTLLPFLYFNLFGDEKRGNKTFMGDTGSMTIGMIMVFLAIQIVSPSVVPQHTSGVNPIMLAFSPLILPLFDVVRVFIHRVKAGRNPFYPDRAHVHHKLLAAGLSQHVSLGIILLGAVAFLAVNVLLSPSVNVNILIAADIAVWTCAHIALTGAIRRREKRLGMKLYE